MFAPRLRALPVLLVAGAIVAMSLLQPSATAPPVAAEGVQPTATGTAASASTTATPTATRGAETTRTATSTRTGEPTRTPGASPTATSTVTGTVTTQPAVPLGNLKFITPVRVVDTRSAAASGNPAAPVGFVQDPAWVPGNPLGERHIIRFMVSGKTFGGYTFPSAVSGVLANVTIVQPYASGGFATLVPGDTTVEPHASTVNPSTSIATNFWTTRVPLDGPYAGTVGVYSTNRIHLVVDVVGFWSPLNPATVGNLKFVNPTRVVDTRAAPEGPIGYNPDGTPITAAPLQANAARRFLVGGKTFGSLAIPADLTGALLHVTLIQREASGGYVTLYPGDAPQQPNVSTVNPSTPISFNSWAVGFPPAGTLSVYSTNQLDIAIDVIGYWSPSNPATLGELTLHSPVRVVDTRGDAGQPVGYRGEDGQPAAPGALTEGSVQTFRVAGRTFDGLSVPADAKGVLVNVTIVQEASSGGYVTVYPADGARPNASTVNPSTAIASSFWATGLALAGPNAGSFALYSTNRLHAVVDLVGYYR